MLTGQCTHLEQMEQMNLREGASFYCLLFSLDDHHHITGGAVG